MDRNRNEPNRTMEFLPVADIADALMDLAEPKNAFGGIAKSADLSVCARGFRIDLFESRFPHRFRSTSRRPNPTPSPSLSPKSCRSRSCRSRGRSPPVSPLGDPGEGVVLGGGQAGGEPGGALGKPWGSDRDR